MRIKEIVWIKFKITKQANLVEWTKIKGMANLIT